MLSLDFQRLSYKDFESEGFFIKAIAREILKKPGLNQIMPDSVRGGLKSLCKAATGTGGWLISPVYSVSGVRSR